MDWLVAPAIFLFFLKKKKKYICVGCLQVSIRYISSQTLNIYTLISSIFYVSNMVAATCFAVLQMQPIYPAIIKLVICYNFK